MQGLGSLIRLNKNTFGLVVVNCQRNPLLTVNYLSISLQVMLIRPFLFSFLLSQRAEVFGLVLYFNLVTFCY